MAHGVKVRDGETETETRAWDEECDTGKYQCN